MLRNSYLIFTCILWQSLIVSDSSLTSVLPHVSSNDAQIILNVLYRSYARSAITLSTQTKALEQLTHHWDLWHSCAARRLDPNAYAPQSDKSGEYDSFIAFVAKYHGIHDAYASLIDHATRSSSYHSRDAYELIQSIRNKARSIVFEAVTKHLHEIKNALEEALLTQQMHINGSSRERGDIDTQASTRDGLLNSLVNHLATHSFAEFNETFITKTDHLFRSFLFAQNQFNSLWHAIETARSAFYARSYAIAYNILKSSNFPEYTFYIVNTDSPETPQQRLPLPSQLTTYDLI